MTIQINNLNGNFNVYTNECNQDSDEPEEVSEVMRASNYFCRITEEAYEKGKAKAVEEELRRACVSAPKLVAAIRTNEALDYLDTQNLSSKELYELLNEHFNLPFTGHNFTVYRSRSH